MIRKHFAAIAALAFACTLAGCAPVHRVDRATSDQAKVFVPLNDKAVVYVYRNTIFGAAISMGVDVDSVRVGSTGPNSFFKLALPPGKHTIVSHAENSDTVDIDVKAGERYYVWQDVKLGFLIMRTGLHVVSTAEGEREVKSLKLLRTEAPQFRMPEADAPDAAKAAAPAAASAAPSAAADPVTTAPAAAPSAPTHSSVPGTAPEAKADDTTQVDAPATTSSQPASGGIAALDDRVSKPMFVAAQDIASKHQCERLLRVRSVDGDDAHFYSTCSGSTTPIEIACHGSACNEAAPQG